MTNKTIRYLWEEDLKLFEGEYKKHMNEYCDYMAIDPKVMEVIILINLVVKNF